MGLSPSLLSFDNKKKPHYTDFYRFRRFLNWFPLGFGYASMIFMRYCLNTAQSALADDKLLTDSDFHTIFAFGSAMYVVGFFTLARMVDIKGGRWGMIVGLIGTIVANIVMSLFTGLAIQGQMSQQMFFWSIMAIYGFNMFFQSLGAMSIVTTKMPWFHVRERGTFGTIFGVMISFGLYFAFDWGYAIKYATRAVIDHPEKLSYFSVIFRNVFETGGKGFNESWWSFLFPALFGIVWLIPIAVTLRNKPKDAGFEEFDTGDDHISETALTMRQMFREVFLNPKHRVVMIICLIEFCSGAIRNGSIQIFPKFAEHIGFKHDFWISHNWGLALLIAGIIGANATGWVSDKVFNSRRGPMVMVLYTLIISGILMIIVSLDANVAHNGSMTTGIGIFIVVTCIIGVHGILSGTAAGDFSGVKNTAKAVGIVDGAVYVGTSIQSFLMGRYIPIDDLTGKNKTILSDANNWTAWPYIILPFVIVGTILCITIYHALPKGRRAH